MKNLIIPIISMLFLSGCMVAKDTLHTAPPSAIQIAEKPKQPIEKSQLQIREYGDNWILSQTGDMTVLAYNGTIVKRWSHRPPTGVPFISDEACTAVWKGFQKLSSEELSSTGRQSVWNTLSLEEKKSCMQEYYASTGTISVEPIDTRFYLMRHAVRYEQYNQYIYDISHKQLQEMQFTGDIDLTYTSTGITITITELDNTQKHIYYNPDFTPYLP